jgi:hypothetical protein
VRDWFNANRNCWRAPTPLQTERTPPAAYRTFEAYDPASDTWWHMPSMLLPLRECIMAAIGMFVEKRGKKA